MCSHRREWPYFGCMLPGCLFVASPIIRQIFKITFYSRRGFNLSVGFSAEDLIMNLPDQVILIQQRE